MREKYFIRVHKEPGGLRHDLFGLLWDHRVDKLTVAVPWALRESDFIEVLCGAFGAEPDELAWDRRGRRVRFSVQLEGGSERWRAGLERLARMELVSLVATRKLGRLLW